MPLWGTIVLGLATFAGAIISAIAVLRKTGPEINQIQIQSANNLVAMAETSAQMSKEVADDLRTRNRDLDNRVTEMSRLVGIAQSEIEEMRNKLGEISVLRRKVAELTGRLEEVTREKQGLAEENVSLRERVTNLTLEVRKLEHEVERLRTRP